MRNLKKSDGAPTAIMYLAKDSSSNNNNNTTSDTVEETTKDTIQETKKDTVQITVNILDSDTNKPLENASIQLDTDSKKNFYNYKTNKYENNIEEAKTLDISKRTNKDISVLKYIYNNTLYCCRI